MTEQQLNKLKDQLTDYLEDIKQRIHEDPILDTTELSNYDNHPADNASDLTDQNTELAIENHKEEEIEKAKAALQAIEDGTYGICRVCGEDIGYDRLEALPTALTCIKHANHEGISDSRPVEEEILGSSTDQPIKDDDGVADYINSFEDLENYGSSDTPQDVEKDAQKDFYKN